MDEESFEMEEEERHVHNDEADHHSEFPLFEETEQDTFDLHDEGDLDYPGSVEESLEGTVDVAAEFSETEGSPGNDGMFIFEDGVYEESLYGGEFSRWEDYEAEKPAVQQVPDKEDGRPGIELSTKSILKSKTSADVIPLTPLKPKPDLPCLRGRMRSWLNRNSSVEPHKESFLGMPYSRRDLQLNPDDPCRSLYFGKERDTMKSVLIKEKAIEERKICACDQKSWETYKASTLADSKRDIPASSVSTTRHGSTSSKDSDLAPETCRCGAKTFPSPSGGPKVSEWANIGTIGEKDTEGGVEAPRNLGICTCGKKPLETPHQRNKRVKEKIHKLLKKMLRERRCHCPKTGWKPSRMWSRKKQKCICKHLKRKQLRFHEAVNKIWQKERNRNTKREIQKIKEGKIEELYKAIGPKLAAQYRQLASNSQKTKRLPKNDFVRRTLKEFGSQMEHYKRRSLENGTAFSSYDRTDYNSFQYLELPSGSVYYGQFSPFGMEGKCIYKMCHGPIFVGTMIDGKMEGPGQLIYPNGGRVEGTWVAGALYDPKYTFSDGLKFEPTGWKYCRMPDRRFVSEIIKGMNSPDNVQLCANHPARQIPKGCLDAGEGFYDPKRKIIIHPSTGKTIRIVNEPEGQWILKNCRREWFEEVPFSRHMYENWYAGTVFTPPLDEADWFAEEFPPTYLPFDIVDDVLEARRMAAVGAIGH